MIVVAPTMRGGRRDANVAGVCSAKELHLRVTVDRDATPISGQVAAGGGRERPFAGWTELFAALQAVIGEHPNREEQDAETR